MKAVKIIGRILGVTLAALIALVGLASLVKVPILGSIATFGTVEYGHIAIPVGIVLFATSWLLFATKEKVFPSIVVVLLAVALATSCAAFGSAVQAFKKEGVSVKAFGTHRSFEDVQKASAVYTQGLDGDLPLDLYYLSDGQTGKPVVVYVHGGGWTTGDRNNLLYRTKSLAQEGCVSVTVEYDLSSKDRHLADSTELQVTKALAWVALHAAEYGGDIDKLFLIGDSAGGQLALDLAYKINGGVYTMADGVTLPTVKGVCGLYPVADPVGFYHNDDPLLGAGVKNMCVCYVGATPEEDPAGYQEITPANFITAATPPTLLILGKADTAVPTKGSHDLYQALLDNGTPARLVEIPYTNHAFDYVDGNFGAEGVTGVFMQFVRSLS